MHHRTGSYSAFSFRELCKLMRFFEEESPAQTLNENRHFPGREVAAMIEDVALRLLCREMAIGAHGRGGHSNNIYLYPSNHPGLHWNYQQ